MKKIIYSKKKGFSVAETLLASFVLIVGIISIVELASRNIKNIANSRNTIVASELAQEGIELVRNARDNNAGRRYLDKRQGLPLTDLFRGFSSCGGGIDYSSYYNNGLSCSSKLNLKVGVDGFYKISNDSSSNFKRRIILTSSGTPVTYKVYSLVTWGNTPVPTDINKCSISNKCVYSQTELTTWNSKG